MGCACSRNVVSINKEKYSIKENIGEGGFSTIDLAYAMNSGKQVALKHILCHSQGDIDKALKEAKLHFGLMKHDNIVPCLAFDEIKLPPKPSSSSGAISEIIMVFPYYEGGSLQQKIDLMAGVDLNYNVDKICFIFLGICEACRVLWEVCKPPICHRDLKPANILLNGSVERPALMDFGSATTTKIQVNNSKEALAWQDYAAENCTMTYRAPELFAITYPSVIDERSEIWSLGCVLYALCYNEGLFDSVHARGDSVALAVQSDTIPFRSSKLNADERFPVLQGIIRDMLQHNPDKRISLRESIQRISALTGLPQVST